MQGNYANSKKTGFAHTVTSVSELWREASLMI